MLDVFLFSIFAGFLLTASTMTVFAREPIHSALWLMLAFSTAAMLWISLAAEFLGLILILVYVGAVLTLFLFVIMTLPTTPMPILPKWHKVMYYSLVSALVFLWLFCLGYALFYDTNPTKLIAIQPTNNTQTLGETLYTHYLYPFELVGILLLVAIIVSISLHSDPLLKDTRRYLSKSEQLNIKRSDRIKLVKGD